MVGSMVVCVCNLSTEEETGSYLGSLPSQHSPLEPLVQKAKDRKDSSVTE